MVVPRCMVFVLVLLLVAVGVNAQTPVAEVLQPEETVFHFRSVGLRDYAVTVVPGIATTSSGVIAPATVSCIETPGQALTSRSVHTWRGFTDAAAATSNPAPTLRTLATDLHLADGPSTLVWHLAVDRAGAAPIVVPELRLDVAIRSDASLRADDAAYDALPLIAEAHLEGITLAGPASTGPVSHTPAGGRDLYEFEFPLTWHAQRILQAGFNLRVDATIDAPCDGQTVPPGVYAYQSENHRHALNIPLDAPVQWRHITATLLGEEAETTTAPLDTADLESAPARPAGRPVDGETASAIAEGPTQHQEAQVRYTLAIDTPYGLADVVPESVRLWLTDADGKRIVAAPEAVAPVPIHNSAPPAVFHFGLTNLAAETYTVQAEFATYTGGNGSFEGRLDFRAGTYTSCVPLGPDACTLVTDLLWQDARNTSAAPVALLLASVAVIAALAARRSDSSAD